LVLGATLGINIDTGWRSGTEVIGVIDTITIGVGSVEPRTSDTGVAINRTTLVWTFVRLECAFRSIVAEAIAVPISPLSRLLWECVREA